MNKLRVCFAKFYKDDAIELKEVKENKYIRVFQSQRAINMQTYIFTTLHLFFNLKLI
jgi:hypothetical protein